MRTVSARYPLIIVASLPALLGIRLLLPVSSISELRAVSAVTVLLPALLGIACYVHYRPKGDSIASIHSVLILCATAIAFGGAHVSGSLILTEQLPTAVQVSHSGDRVFMVNGPQHNRTVCAFSRDTGHRLWSLTGVGDVSAICESTNRSDLLIG